MGGTMSTHQNKDSNVTNRNTKSTGSGIRKFELGTIVFTPAVAETLTQHEVGAAIGRHSRGDWGNVSPDDWRENDASVQLGLRLISTYETSDGTEFLVITESDRSATTVLFPHEY